LTRPCNSWPRDIQYNNRYFNANLSVLFSFFNKRVETVTKVLIYCACVFSFTSISEEEVVGSNNYQSQLNISVYETKQPSIINNLDENLVSREEYFIIIQEVRRRRSREWNTEVQINKRFQYQQMHSYIYCYVFHS
jgi:hypothetical protein